MFQHGGSWMSHQSRAKRTREGWPRRHAQHLALITSMSRRGSPHCQPFEEPREKRICIQGDVFFHFWPFVLAPVHRISRCRCGEETRGRRGGREETMEVDMIVHVRYGNGINAEAAPETCPAKWISTVQHPVTPKSI